MLRTILPSVLLLVAALAQDGPRGEMPTTTRGTLGTTNPDHDVVRQTVMTAHPKEETSTVNSLASTGLHVIKIRPKALERIQPKSDSAPSSFAEARAVLLHAAAHAASKFPSAGSDAAIAGELVSSIQTFDASAFMTTLVVARLAPGLPEALADSPDIEWVEEDVMLTTTVIGRPVPISREAALGHTNLLDSTETKLDTTRGDRQLFSGRSLLQRTTTSAALDRSDQRTLPLNSAYNYVWDGANVDVYVMDSGVLAGHEQFGARVSLDLGQNFVPDQAPSNATDVCNGHGTSVASQCCGNTLGAAAGSRIIPIRVYNCDGTATTSILVAAVNYVISTAASTGRRSIINFSGGGWGNLAVDAVAEAASAAGILFVDSAGNEGADACTSSPARAGGSFTVAASTVTDGFAYFTNVGRCVNLTAIGVNNILASYRGPAAYTTMSGTSFSAPLVSGVAATVWSSMPALTAVQVARLLVQRATYGVLPSTGLYATTPNALAYSLPFGNGDLSVSPTPTATGSPTPAASLASCPVAFIEALGVSGSLPQVASSLSLSLSYCLGRSVRSGTKIVYRIDLGPAVNLGGNLTVQTCGLSSGDTWLYLGRGCPLSDDYYQCSASNDDSRCGLQSITTLYAVYSRYTYVVVADYRNTAITSGISWSYVSPSDANSAVTYSPCGPQVNVSTSVPTAGGWAPCYTDRYNNYLTPLSTILSQCNRTSLMLACRPVSSPHYSVLAWARREEVLAVANNEINPSFIAFGSKWYYDTSFSWGFAQASDSTARNTCDTEQTNMASRLCWHTGDGYINGGFSCGAARWLNSDTTYERVVLHGGPPAAPPQCTVASTSPTGTRSSSPSTSPTPSQSRSASSTPSPNGCLNKGFESGTIQPLTLSSPDLVTLVSSAVDLRNSSATIYPPAVLGGIQMARLMTSSTSMAPTTLSHTFRNVVHGISIRFDVNFNRGDALPFNDFGSVTHTFTSAEGRPPVTTTLFYSSVEGLAAAGNTTSGWVRVSRVFDGEGTHVLTFTAGSGIDESVPSALFVDLIFACVRLAGGTPNPTRSPDPVSCGPRVNVPSYSITAAGWTRCHNSSYADTVPLEFVLSACGSAYLMLACRPVGSPTYTLAAWAPRAVALHLSNGEYDSHAVSNGMQWYFSPEGSWGVALEGDEVFRDPCDVGATNPQFRMCWNTEGRGIQAGYRCGATTGIGNRNWERLVLQANAPSTAVACGVAPVSPTSSPSTGNSATPSPSLSNSPLPCQTVRFEGRNTAPMVPQPVSSVTVVSSSLEMAHDDANDLLPPTKVFTPQGGAAMARLLTGAGTNMYTTLNLTYNVAGLGRGGGRRVRITLWALFDTSENASPSYNDDAVVSFTFTPDDGGAAAPSASVLWAASAVGVGRHNDSGWVRIDATVVVGNGGAGTHRLTAGVRNRGDNTGPSVLLLDDVSMCIDGAAVSLSPTVTQSPSGTPPVRSPLPTPSRSPFPRNGVAFAYLPVTPGPQLFSVPPGVTTLSVHLWGGGGGGAGASSTGGGGAYLSGNIYVTPGETLRVTVGRGGGFPGTAGSAAAAGGGGGGSCSGGLDTGSFGGGGGGFSMLQRAGSGAVLALAGGGGGGGAGALASHGGAAGYFSARRGGDQAASHNYLSGGLVSHGGGGNQAQPGIGTFSGATGTAMGGGNATRDTSPLCGGGGGGGRFGGGAGGAGGGGGGGSSVVDGLRDTIIGTDGRGRFPGGNTTSLYLNGVGMGGAGRSSGGHGYVVLLLPPGVLPISATRPPTRSGTPRPVSRSSSRTPPNTASRTATRTRTRKPKVV